MDVALALTGLAVGLTVGVTGVGGGSLMTPALIGLFRIPPAVAVGTDLAFAAITKAVGTGANARRGRIDRRVAGLLMAGSLPACVAALGWLWWAGGTAGAGSVLRTAIGCSLLLTCGALLWRDRLLAWSASVSATPDPAWRDAATVGAGVLIGTLVALSSIGAGAVGCVAIAMLHPRLQAREVAATDLAYAVPLTAIASVGHGLAGHIDWSLLATLLAGSVPGVLIGTRLSGRLPDAVVRRLLAGVLALAAAKTMA